MFLPHNISSIFWTPLSTGALQINYPLQCNLCTLFWNYKDLNNSHNKSYSYKVTRGFFSKCDIQKWFVHSCIINSWKAFKVKVDWKALEYLQILLSSTVHVFMSHFWLHFVSWYIIFTVECCYLKLSTI